MYSSVRTYSGNPDFADTLAGRLDDLRQVIGQIAGFNGYYVVKGADATTTISVFADQTGAEESNRAAAAWVAENLPDAGIAAPQVVAGEVVVSF